MTYHYIVGKIIGSAADAVAYMNSVIQDTGSQAVHAATREFDASTSITLMARSSKVSWRTVQPPEAAPLTGWFSKRRQSLVVTSGLYSAWNAFTHRFIHIAFHIPGGVKAYADRPEGVTGCAVCAGRGVR